jgi:hypothetical protein
MPSLDPVDERPGFVEVDLEGSVGSGSDLGCRRGPDVLPDQRNVIEVAYMIVNH